MNEEEILEFITNNKCYKDILEIHDKYYNMLLGKKIKFSFKSFTNMMKDILMCQRRFIKTMLKFELLIEEGGLSMNLQFKHSSNEIKNSGYWVIKNNSFLWINDFNTMFEEYGTTINESNI